MAGSGAMSSDKASSRDMSDEICHRSLCCRYALSETP
jgi:hypothetical protein